MGVYYFARANQMEGHKFTELIGGLINNVKGTIRIIYRKLWIM